MTYSYSNQTSKLDKAFFCFIFIAKLCIFFGIISYLLVCAWPNIIKFCNLVADAFHLFSSMWRLLLENGIQSALLKFHQAFMNQFSDMQTITWIGIITICGGILGTSLDGSNNDPYKLNKTLFTISFVLGIIFLLYTPCCTFMHIKQDVTHTYISITAILVLGLIPMLGLIVMLVWLMITGIEKNKIKIQETLFSCILVAIICWISS